MTTLHAKPHIALRTDGSAVVEYRVRGRQQIKDASALVSVQSMQNYGGGAFGGSWVRMVEESFPGAWQQNVTLRSTRDLLAYPPVYACVTLIAGDIAKLRMRLTKRTDDDIWLESAISPSSPFLLPLRRPNPYQTPYQFWTAWAISRVLNGNAYVLKVRDNRGMGEGNGNVRQLHVLDPCLVCPKVFEETGEVFYELRRDYLSGIDTESVVVPASEIIHDRVTPLWHPLIGVAPLYAAALSGTQGVNIQTNSAKFFENMSRPSGMLIAPGAINKEQMAAIKEAWETNYGANNMGKTAVLGDGMKYEPMSVPANDSQLTDQWKLSALGVAMAFHVPPYKIGLQSDLKFNNMAQQDMDYYKQCLQTHMESMEQSLDSGLELPVGYRSQFDERMLFRMDPLSRAQAAGEAIKASYMAPNEARRDEDMPPVTGGNEPLSQQQNWPLSVLAKRDPPTSNPAPPPVAEPVKAIDFSTVAMMLNRAGPPRLRAA